ARRFLMAHHIRLRRPDRAWHTGPDIEADQAELARESNAVSEYLSTMTVTDPTVEGVTPTVLYASYRVWCESNQARPLGRNTFLAAIRKYTPTIPEWKLPGGHPLAGQRRFRVRLISDE
ncbi:MAG TPA: primase-like DNA-binding domain-containing protein, partial [Nakamurella sp.]